MWQYRYLLYNVMMTVCIMYDQCDACFFFFALKSSTFSGNVGKRRVKLNSPNLWPTIPSRTSNGTNTLPL